MMANKGQSAKTTNHKEKAKAAWEEGKENSWGPSNKLENFSMLKSRANGLKRGMAFLKIIIPNQIKSKFKPILEKINKIFCWR